MALEYCLNDKPSSPQAIEKLREALKKAGYNNNELCIQLDLSNVQIFCALNHQKFASFYYKLKDKNGVAKLFILFFLGLPIEHHELEISFSTEVIAFCEEIGLIKVVDGKVRSLYSIIPFHDLLILNDKYYTMADTEISGKKVESEEKVWPLEYTSLVMAGAIMKGQFKNALDIGCGCGVQSLLMAKYCHKVTGIDINPRAISIANFNAVLNNLTNIDFLQGNIYDTVPGQKFDLIISSPAQVPGLDNDKNRGGGPCGADMVAKIFSGLEQHLEENGFCQSTMHLIHTEEQDMLEWLKEMLPVKNKTLILRHYKVIDAEQFALNELSNKNDFKSDQQKYLTKFIELYEKYRNNSIKNISFGLITIQRTKDNGWMYLKTANLRGNITCHYIQRFFEKHNRININEFLNYKLIINKNCYYLNKNSFANSNSQFAEILIENDNEDYFSTTKISSEALELVNLFNGERTVKDISGMFMEKYGNIGIEREGLINYIMGLYLKQILN